ncbi:MAG: hypothetical protein AAB036_05080 [Elusimicrobiota bacterium]
MIKGAGWLIIALVALCPLALADISYAAGRIFFDDAETGNANLWTADGTRPKCTVVSSSADRLKGPYAGSYMIQCNDPGSAWQTLRGPTFSIGSEVLYRYRVRVDSNHDSTDGSVHKIGRIFHWTGDSNTYVDVFSMVGGVGDQGLRNDLIIDGERARGGALYWGDHPNDHTASPSTWHQVEYYINTITGAAKVWHDDILVQNEVYGPVRGGVGNAGEFYMTSNWEDARDGTNYVYFDNVEIFTDLGTGGVGSLSLGDIAQGGGSSGAATPPALPTNLRVQ